MAGRFDTSGFFPSWFDGKQPAYPIVSPKNSVAAGLSVPGYDWAAVQPYVASGRSSLTRMMAYLFGMVSDCTLLPHAMQALQQIEGGMRVAGYESPTNDFEVDKQALRAAKLDTVCQALLEVIHAETMPPAELATPHNISALSRAIGTLRSKEVPQIVVRGLYHLAQANENFWQELKKANPIKRATPSDLGMDEYERIVQLVEKFPGCASNSIMAATYFNMGRFKSHSGLIGARIYSRPDAEADFWRAEQFSPGFLDGRSAAEWAHAGFQDDAGIITNPEVIREHSTILVAPLAVNGIYKVLERKKNDLSDTVARLAQMNLSNRNTPDQVIASVTSQDAASYTGVAYESAIGGDRRSDLWRLSRFSNHPGVRAAAEIALARTLGDSWYAVKMAHFRRAKTSIPESMSPQLHAFADFNISICENILTPVPTDAVSPLPDAGAAAMAQVKRLADQYPGKVDPELLGKALYNLALDQKKPRHPAYDIEAARANLLLALRCSTNPVVLKAAKARLAEMR